MSAPRKSEQEFRERALRMCRERLAEPGESKRGARHHVGALLNLNPETLRNWAEERDRSSPAVARRRGRRSRRRFGCS
jgi:transposase